MPAAIVVATIALASATLLLAALILITRARNDRRRSRAAAARPAMEMLIAEFLSGEQIEAPRSALDRRILLRAGLEALAELRGKERDRITALLEQTGIVDEISAEIESGNARVRRQAAEKLVEIRSKRAAHALLRGLEDGDARVRLACAAALAELADPAFADRIVATANAEAADRPGAVAPIVLSLGQRLPDVLAKALAPGMVPELRRLAAAVIGELRLAEHAEALRAALADPDDELVSRAVKGLGEIGDAESVPGLLDVLVEQRQTFVHLAVIAALGKIGDPSVASALELPLRFGDWQLRQVSSSILARLGADGRAVLERAATSPDPALRVQIESVLA